MSTSDGAQGRQSPEDPALATALAEMSAEGGFNPQGALSDLGTADPGASQQAPDASAAPAAAPPAPTGDDGTQSQTRQPTDGAPPAGSPSADPSAADPLHGTEPFTYNGTTYDGIYRVPGEGLLIPADREAAFTAIVERAALADALDQSAREYQTQTATFERLSQWPITDEKGAVTETLTGLKGLEARFVNDARKDAALGIVDEMLGDPVKFLFSLIAKDAAGNLVQSPEGMEMLSMRLRLAANEAEAKTRADFQRAIGPQPPTAAPSGTGPTDYSHSAPKLIAQTAGADAGVLTAEDRATLTAQLGRYVRDVTDEDRRYNPALKAGGKIVDASYGQLVQHIVAARKAAAAQAKAAETAGKHNAGMDKGRQPPKTAPKPAAPVAPPKQPERRRADWDGPLSGALEEMGIAR